MSATKKDLAERVAVLERRLANVHEHNAALSAKLEEAERDRDFLMNAQIVGRDELEARVRELEKENRELRAELSWAGEATCY
jgi:chromosome segregation ATPase